MKFIKLLAAAAVALTFTTAAFAQSGQSPIQGDTGKMTYGREADLAKDKIKSYNYDAVMKFDEKFVAISPEAQVAKMGRGINIIGGYDPYWEGKASKFKLSDIRRAKDAGFTTVRVPLFTFRQMDAQGKLNPVWLERLDTIIDTALKADLIVILDEHDFDDCAKDIDSCAVILPNVWYELSERYKNAPNSVIFELLNEPHSAIDEKVWNAWVPDLIGIVRETNPQRNIIVGPIFWNSADYLDKLVLPENDRHLIATFHYYTPMEFTHQGTTWAGPELEKLRGVRWTGTPEELAKINTTFDKVQAWGKAHNRPIFLGEFGAYNLYSSEEDRAKWTAAVARAAEARGFAHAAWYWDGGFGVWDENAGKWRGPILNALIPDSPALR